MAVDGNRKSLLKAENTFPYNGNLFLSGKMRPPSGRLPPLWGVDGMPAYKNVGGARFLLQGDWDSHKLAPDGRKNFFPAL
jgi:hypothetical protein